MKITVYYEDNRDRTTIEVPDEDCEIWVENDYQRRLAEAEDKSSVVRRTPQQIMDEDCNCPTYNNQHAETRRHVSLDALDPMGDTVPGAEDAEPDIYEDEISVLHEAIATLDPRQRDLIRKVFWQDIKQVEIARDEGVAEAAVSQRLSRIYTRLKKVLEEIK